jgi:hypothetical protein
MTINQRIGSGHGTIRAHEISQFCDMTLKAQPNITVDELDTLVSSLYGDSRDLCIAAIVKHFYITNFNKYLKDSTYIPPRDGKQNISVSLALEAIKEELTVPDIVMKAIAVDVDCTPGELIMAAASAAYCSAITVLKQAKFVEIEEELSRDYYLGDSLASIVVNKVLQGANDLLLSTDDRDVSNRSASSAD